jgi:protein-tyrosine phosphatase
VRMLLERLRASLERVLGALGRSSEPLLAPLLERQPIRRSLHRRALRAWRATEEPLIVCMGNINRSPFAAELACRRAESRARSAGLYPIPDRPSPPLTVSAARAYGVDLQAHRSSTLDAATVAHAPAIFIFDLENLARLSVRYPLALWRAHFVGGLSDSGTVLISDPHGHEQPVLERVLSQIAGAIERADLDR